MMKTICIGKIVRSTQHVKSKAALVAAFLYVVPS